MEYRFFYPINESIMHSKWRAVSGIEQRTDIYFILPNTFDSSDDLHLTRGLKLRSKKTLELKIREERFVNGQEYWIKKIHHNRRFQAINIELICECLALINENSVIERLKSSPSIVLCYVKKFRQQHCISDNIVQEQTGLEIRFVRFNDQSQIGSDLFFETVCVEQPDRKLIDEKYIQNLSNNYSTINISPMGYPEFLYRQYQQMINA